MAINYPRDFPPGFDPSHPLPGDGESHLACAFNAEFLYGQEISVARFFRDDAIEELMDRCDADSRYPYSDSGYCRRQMLLACIAREDRMAFRKHVNYWWDWRGGDRRKFATVSKFVPGDHFHVKMVGYPGRKFDTLAEAKEFIAAEGYIFGKLIEKHVYNRLGD